MKRSIVALAVAALVAGPAVAQESPLLELVRSDFRTQKVAIVTAAMQLNDDQSSAFWPIYRQYEAELTALWDQRLALIRDYGQSYETMTDEKAKQLAQDALRLEEQQVKLRKKYFDRMSKAVGPVLAARFLQVENQIAALVSVQLAEEMPLIRKPE
jgi:hypothetical protein